MAKGWTVQSRFATGYKSGKRNRRDLRSATNEAREWQFVNAFCFLCCKFGVRACRLTRTYVSRHLKFPYLPFLGRRRKGSPIWIVQSPQWQRNVLVVISQRQNSGPRPSAALPGHPTPNSYPATPLSFNLASNSSADGARGRQTRGHTEGHAEGESQRERGDHMKRDGGAPGSRSSQLAWCVPSPSLLFSTVRPRGRAVVQCSTPNS